MSTALAKIETSESAVIKRDEPSVGQMMQALISSDLTPEKVAVIKELVPLHRDMMKWDAEREFNRAFTAMQNELPQIEALKTVPNRDGSARFKFADYKTIMDQVQPCLAKHGFSVRFSSKPDDKRITMSCTLMHKDGHSITNEFSVRIGSGPPGSSEAQADGSAASYAQRGALCDMLNIVVRTDSDARIEGGTITPEQANSLEYRVKSCGASEELFLKFAGVTDYKDIPSSKYALLDANLSKKERTVE